MERFGEKRQGEVKRLEIVLASNDEGLNYGRSSENGKERTNQEIFGENQS